MHLKSITLRGFKSFPDRTQLQFAPGISVVVGPNGSGKSNITDGVLWAMGEQSPVAVRGQSMQDVIFAGAHGVQARKEAEVEVVIDNSDGAVSLPVSEISIARRLDRAGDGEYRLNGARCRLVDVLEVLSDTGLGKEMHSVVSQGRVESIVTSKPKDRRLLIEEAAGLGKHRKRRRRAQLKLDRTIENLDRALDIEREARTRLRPLKRQAEAAELHERLERQILEARWTLAGEAARRARLELQEAAAAARTARDAREAVAAELTEVHARRAAAEVALSERGAQREALAAAYFAARSAGDRVTARLDAARRLAEECAGRIPRRRERIATLESELASDAAGEGGAERIASLVQARDRLLAEGRERLERELAELEQAHAAAERELATAEAVVAGKTAARAETERAAETARESRREADRVADAARREAARLGSELAQLNAAVRRHTAAPGGATTLAASLDAEPGHELALAAALDGRLTAALAASREDAAELLGRAGRDGATVLVVPDVLPEGGVPAPPRREGATPLIELVVPRSLEAAALAAALLEDVYLVDDIDALPPDFDGAAVTLSGRTWIPGRHELRQTVAGGEEKLLQQRNRRDALVGEVERAAQAEAAAKAAAEAAQRELAAFDARRDEADRELRLAVRAREDAREAERAAAKRIKVRRSAPDEGPSAVERAKIEAELAAEKRLAERLERERAERARRIDHERARLAADEQLLPGARRIVDALGAVAEAVAHRVALLQAERDQDRSADDALAAELRACAKQEADTQQRLARAGDQVTSTEVAAQRARDKEIDTRQHLHRLAQKLGLDPEPSSDPLPEHERAALRARIEKLEKRRSQLGPVNPLAKAELEEAVAHVEELEKQREDLEHAMRDLRQLIKDTDTRIRESFEETFTATARNFEEVCGQLFPGGRGRLRLVREDAGPRPVIGGDQAAAEGADASAEAAEAKADAEAEAGFAAREGEAGPGADLGVEIEITPAGKSTKRLSLLSGGEKSMTALAFIFAVFLAKPCPFYILDEVEAALDDLNIERFITMLRRYADRAQFIVVTHQKRTMEAADVLYGVSMAGNGVSKVVSRRLPQADRPAEVAA